MRKITGFTKNNISEIHTALRATLEAFGKEHGIGVTSGQISYSDDDFSIKITGIITSDDGATAQELMLRKAFTDNAARKGLSPSDLFKTITHNGTAYKIVGMRPRATKDVIIESSIGTHHVMASNLVKKLLEANTDKPTKPASKGITIQVPSRATPEKNADQPVLDKIAKLEELVTGLASRWSHESKYEDINDYAASIQKKLPRGVVLKTMSSKPFGFTFVTGKSNLIYVCAVSRGKFVIKQS